MMNKASVLKRLKKLTPPQAEGKVYFVDTQEEADELSQKKLPPGSVIFIGDVAIED